MVTNIDIMVTNFQFCISWPNFVTSSGYNLRRLSNATVQQMAKRSNESDVWKSCKRLDDGKHASCEICGEKLSCRGGSTSALRKHLHLLHPSASNVQIQILSLYKQTNVYTTVIEISVILIKQSLYDGFASFLELVHVM